MSSQFSRPLNSVYLAETFLEKALGYVAKSSLYIAISNSEIALPENSEKKDTLVHEVNRVSRYRSDPERWKLRQKIADELFAYKRIEDDDSIKLGRGGALPRTPVIREKKAYIIIGLPASGKSVVANFISDETGSVVLDVDYAKRKLPEYKPNLPHGGASLVHEESSLIVYGKVVAGAPSCFRPLYALCSQEGYNVCMSKTGNDLAGVLQLAEFWKNILGYEVHLVLVQVDRRIATIRAIKRFEKTGRYVPLSLIFDGYGNDPLISYYRLKEYNKKAAIFSSFGKLSTSGVSPEVVDSDGISPVRLYI